MAVRAAEVPAVVQDASVKGESVIEAEEPVIVLPKASWTVTVGWVANAVAAVALVEKVLNASWEAAAGLTVIALEQAEVRPAAVALM